MRGCLSSSHRARCLAISIIGILTYTVQGDIERRKGGEKVGREGRIESGGRFRWETWRDVREGEAVKIKLRKSKRWENME